MTPAQRAAKAHAYYLKNKACFAEQSARWARAHPEANRRKSLKSYHKRKTTSK